MLCETGDEGTGAISCSLPYRVNCLQNTKRQRRRWWDVDSRGFTRKRWVNNALTFLRCISSYCALLDTAGWYDYYSHVSPWMTGEWQAPCHRGNWQSRQNWLNLLKQSLTKFHTLELKFCIRWRYPKVAQTFRKPFKMYVVESYVTKLNEVGQTLNCKMRQVSHACLLTNF